MSRAIEGTYSHSNTELDPSYPNPTDDGELPRAYTQISKKLFLDISIIMKNLFHMLLIKNIRRCTDEYGKNIVAYYNDYIKIEFTPTLEGGLFYTHVSVYFRDRFHTRWFYSKIFKLNTNDIHNYGAWTVFQFSINIPFKAFYDDLEMDHIGEHSSCQYFAHVGLLPYIKYGICGLTNSQQPAIYFPTLGYYVSPQGGLIASLENFEWWWHHPEISDENRCEKFFHDVASTMADRNFINSYRDYLDEKQRKTYWSY